jgi:DNA-directed RNA polymerase subunit RPC12/RpoP
MTAEAMTTSADERVFLTCPRCGRRMRARPRDVGRMLACPSCEMQILVPPPPRARSTPMPPAGSLRTLDVPPRSTGGGAPPAPNVLTLTQDDLADAPAPPGTSAAIARGEALRRRRHSARPAPRDTRVLSKHIGKTCPYCLSPVKPAGDLTVCPECGIPHHVECWEENGGCTTWGCRAAPRAAIRPVPAGPPVGVGRRTGGDLHRTFRRPGETPDAHQGCTLSVVKGLGAVALVVLFFALAASGAGSGGTWVFLVILWIIISVIRAAGRNG